MDLYIDNLRNDIQRFHNLINPQATLLCQLKSTCRVMGQTLTRPSALSRQSLPSLLPHLKTASLIEKATIVLVEAASSDGYFSLPSSRLFKVQLETIKFEPKPPEAALPLRRKPLDPKAEGLS